MNKFAALFLLLTTSVSAFAPSHVPTSSVTKKAFAPTSLHAAQNPFESLLSGFLSKKEAAVVEPEKPKIPDFVCDPDYTLGIAFLGIAASILGLSVAGTFLVVFIFIMFIHAFIHISLCSKVEGGSPSLLGGFAATLHALLGSLFVVQATRIRFVFDATAFELKTVGTGEKLNDAGENIVVGGANRWAYDTFVNYDFLPSIDVPILVYFKETQTPEEKWNEGPGEFDKIGGGQIHFFPAIANVRQLKEQFELRGCAKK